VPEAAQTGLGWLSDLALPLALVLVGSALEMRMPDSDWQALGSVVGLKVVLMPVFAWIAFSALGADPLTRNAAIVMFGAPTAVSTFIYASELGGDAGVRLRRRLRDHRRLRRHARRRAATADVTGRVAALPRSPTPLPCPAASP